MSQRQQTKSPPEITFITGTDTGVGKTVFTAHAVFGLIASGCNAFVAKPFCSGWREDVETLFRAQQGLLSREQINPFFFSQPVAPLVAARLERKRVKLSAVTSYLRQLGRGCEHLLVEGAGGLLVPLGEGYNAIGLMKRLNCRAIVVSQNRLGTINHTLLTVDRLHQSGIKCAGVVLMEPRRGDLSSASNYAVLKEFLGKVPLVSFPWLGRNPASARTLEAMQKKFKKSIARLFV